MADKPNLVHVEIFGQSYAVRAGADPGYVEKLAAHVDEQMREVSRGGGAVDSVRIAVLAALNIADECFRLREQVERGGEGRPHPRGEARAGAERRPRGVASLPRSIRTLACRGATRLSCRARPSVVFVMDQVTSNQRP